MYGKLPNKMGSLNKNESVSKWSYKITMPKIHFRSYIHNQMQRIDKDIVKCPQIVSADNLSNTKKEERITLHLLMEFAREELSLIKYKTKRRKIIKVHLSLCFVIKYTFSTPWKRKIPCKSAIYKGFVVPRPGLEPGCLAALVFETSASTYSAIWAFSKTDAKVHIFF